MTVDTTAIQAAPVTGSLAKTLPQKRLALLSSLAKRKWLKLRPRPSQTCWSPSLGWTFVPEDPLASKRTSAFEGTFNQTALWVDGIRWSAPHTDHHLLNLPLDPEDITG